MDRINKNKNQVQTTIKNEIGYEGPGLHSGLPVKLLFKPAPADTGIVFVRVDKGVYIPARIENVKSSNRQITLKGDGIQIQTVEHILAALAGLGIDNLYIELDQDEPPVADGSALPFVELLFKAGILSLDCPKRRISVDRPLWVQDGDKSVTIIPAEGLQITYTIDFNHPAIGLQTVTFPITPDIFAKEIAPARTFGFLDEIKPLKEKGFFKGGSLENAVVFDDECILNDTLRFEDEPIRHKILDLIGDLSLLGGAIQGHILVIKSGHSLNLEFSRKIDESIQTITPALSFKTKRTLDIEDIQKILPHRYPFLLVDRILELKDGQKIVGIKNVSGNEPFFRGHFPGRPIMPGVLIIEAMAQVGGVLVLSSPENRGKLVYFAGIEFAKFRRPVVPGDQLRLEVAPIKIRQRIGKMHGQAYVGDDLVAEAQMTFSLSEE